MTFDADWHEQQGSCKKPPALPEII